MLTPNSETDFIALLDEHQNIIHKICRLYTNNEVEHEDLFRKFLFNFGVPIIALKGNRSFLLGCTGWD